jgi:hypothetical protein
MNKAIAVFLTACVIAGCGVDQNTTSSRVVRLGAFPKTQGKALVGWNWSQSEYLNANEGTLTALESGVYSIYIRLGHKRPTMAQYRASLDWTYDGVPQESVNFEIHYRPIVKYVYLKIDTAYLKFGDYFRLWIDGFDLMKFCSDPDQTYLTIEKIGNMP